jgi:ribonucleoside-diphosphate reductase alpha chain
MSTIRDYAYRTSIEIAREKGPFPAFDKISYGASPFVLELSHELQDGIARNGIRNSHLLAVAPAVSVSLLANSVSAGIDPISGFETQCSVPGADGEPVTFTVQDYAWRQFRAMLGTVPEGLNYLVQQMDVDAESQLNMMAAIQPFVDNAIAKTVSLAPNTTPHDVDLVLLRAWELGLKACTVCRGAA